MKEVVIQRSIIDLVIAAGGYGWKLSNAYMAGVPDLLLFWPGFAPVIAEVKYLGCKSGEYDVKIDITPLQRQRLKLINRVGRFGIILVAVKWRNQDYVIGYEHTAERAIVSDIGTFRCTARRKGRLNFGPAFHELGIPRTAHT